MKTYPKPISAGDATQICSGKDRCIPLQRALEHNGDLVENLLGPEIGYTIKVGRGQRQTLIFTCCPFCGEKLPTRESKVAAKLSGKSRRAS